GCRDSTAPERRTTVAVHAGDGQFGTMGEVLADALRVVVTDASTGQPRQGIRVDWQVIEGGAIATPVASTTDERGIATTQIRLGGNLGTVRVRATSAGMAGFPATFTAIGVT